MINVIGAGLAGCEAALAISREGVAVRLFEQKPKRKSTAHESDNFAELVCSNSLKAKRVNSAAGLLKTEMELLGSAVVSAAKKHEVSAGGALAVDRLLFSSEITDMIKNDRNIEVVEGEVTGIPSGITIIATGPLTDGALAEEISKLCGENLSFYDAAAPIITAESVDMESAYLAARYDRGDADYINCPLNKEEYLHFVEELTKAETVILKEFERGMVYEGCMAVEILAKRGVDTLRYGPLKPVGLDDPKTGRWPYAVVQLRAENREKTLYNLVGFQTNLKFGEQKRVFSLIPALKNMDILRYGVMHRNSFINSPVLLSSDLSLKTNSDIFFAGQITGVEGYCESAACGIYAGINAARKFKGEKPLPLLPETMTGALISYVTSYEGKNFQPMGANMGILPPLPLRIKSKEERYAKVAERALNRMRDVK